MPRRDYLASIILEDGHPGLLWWKDRDIWCKDTVTGEEFSTETGCPDEEDAIDTISMAWRDAEEIDES